MPNASDILPGPLEISRSCVVRGSGGSSIPRASAIASSPTTGSRARSRTPPPFPSGLHETLVQKYLP